MPPAARITDMHTCPMVNPGPVPHVGGPVSSGSPNVIIGYQPAGRKSDTAVCVPATDKIAKGSPTVLINNLDAARIGDPTVHGGVIVVGCPTVIIGDSGQGCAMKSAAANAAPFCEECEKAKKEPPPKEQKKEPPPNKPPPNAAALGEPPPAPRTQAASRPPPHDKVHVDEELTKLVNRRVMVPDDPELLRRVHEALRQAVQSRIGEVDVGDPDEVDKWKNTATSVEELHRDAEKTEPLLRSVVDGAAAEAGGEPNYGPGNKHAVKELKSLDDKVNVKGKRLNRISDAVRGTIIVDQPEDIRPAVAALKKRVEAAGGKLVVDNKFAKPHKAGYGAVHADMLLPTKDGGFIRSEVQLHLRGLHDGTAESVKEQSHALYKPLDEKGEEIKLTPAQEERAHQASMLQWHNAMTAYGA